MFTYFIFFLFLLGSLFYLSRLFSKNLFLLLYFLTKNKNTAIELLSWFFLPGTIIHELSHLLMAGLLRVPTGRLTFKPEVRENNEVRVGGLNIAKTDPFRHSLVGLAPLVVGISLIAFINHFWLYPSFQQFFSPPRMASPTIGGVLGQVILIFALCFLIFNLGNTMFSSKSDLQAIFIPVLIVVLLSLALYFTGIKISLELKTINLLDTLFKNLNLALLGTVIIDLVFLGIIGVAQFSARKFRAN